MFCLSPREPVEPAGIYAQGLGRSCSELVLLGVVPGSSQALDQPICSFGTESRGWLACRLGPVLGAASLCSRCALTGGFRCGCPAGVSGVGGQLGFQLWTPSPLIGVHATGLQVSAGDGYPVFTVQGLRREGRQRPRLLRRVL